MDSWNFLQKVYYAEVNLLRHGKRIIDYDTRRDRKDRDKTEKNAAHVIQYIKQGILHVSVTEKHRNETYTAPGCIFSTKMSSRERPTQQKAEEAMLNYLEGLFLGKSAPDTKKRSQEELRTLGRPQIEDSHTVSHQTVSDTSDDWFEHEVYY
ncbi:unnamed protein product [Aspergillus oryzae]|uniref:Unnamed protein product n=1 Tax=Aspergillus oryzae var. brunneus TaxID=332754 RepID=A0ABQ6KRC4_ASPOZ|nr:hypothetical protein AFLA_005933 [Aspergillus flavus NRRL3357]GMF72209.1 unnamed protein product [Aspergillus oryzae]GMF89024.1 unnamed protein product [Aspergillus oryzae]GMG15092.1 unnamed protein product [Aspergillus oryzae]GMG44567.1 unnamed protein product [Aspergillus oryzae var. brunneus]